MGDASLPNELTAVVDADGDRRVAGDDGLRHPVEHQLHPIAIGGDDTIVGGRIRRVIVTNQDIIAVGERHAVRRTAPYDVAVNDEVCAVVDENARSGLQVDDVRGNRDVIAVDGHLDTSRRRRGADGSTADGVCVDDALERSTGHVNHRRVTACGASSGVPNRVAVDGEIRAGPRRNDATVRDCDTRVRRIDKDVVRDGATLHTEQTDGAPKGVIGDVRLVDEVAVNQAVSPVVGNTSVERAGDSIAGHADADKRPSFDSLGIEKRVVIEHAIVHADGIETVAGVSGGCRPFGRSRRAQSRCPQRHR